MAKADFGNRLLFKTVPWFRRFPECLNLEYEVLMRTAFTLRERKKLISRYWQAYRQTAWPVRNTLTSAQRVAAYEAEDALLREYAARLPYVSLSRCPICGDALKYIVDIMGIDGPWWESSNTVDYPEPRSCKHFNVLLGAMDFHGRTLSEAGELNEILPGPAVPYVIPDLLKLPGMRAVLSSFPDAMGDTCYVMAYFAPKRFHGSFLHQPWPRKRQEVYGENGSYEGWRIADSKWDFELGHWLERKALLWIAPGELSSLNVRKGTPCPYENLPGVRQPQLIRKGDISLLPLPEGKIFKPFE